MNELKVELFLISRTTWNVQLKLSKFKKTSTLIARTFYCKITRTFKTIHKNLNV